MYQALADLFMLLHFAFLVVLSLGGFAAWRWPRLILAHVALAIWGILNAVFKVPCPLTDVEDWARRRAGEEGLPQGFIDKYLTGVVYPEENLVAVQLGVAGVIVVSWVGFAVLWRRRRRNVVSHQALAQHDRRPSRHTDDR